MHNTPFKQLPIIVEKGIDGWYVAECPVLEGCYSQGKTIDQALKNISKVIKLILTEKPARQLLQKYHPQELSLHTIEV